MWIKRKIIFFIPLCFLLANCTSISVKLPGATIETSEVAGCGKKELGPSVEPAREVEFTDSLNARPPDLESATVKGGTHTMLHGARFGLGRRFELGGEIGLDLSSDIQTAFHLVGKFQVFGPTKGEAKAGDFSLATFGRLGYVSVDASGDQSVTFGPGGFPWSATVTSYYAMAGASLGYRLADPLLLYLGGAYQGMNATLKVTQEPADDNSDPGGTYERDRKGFSTSYGAGVQLGAGKVFHFNAKVMQFNFQFDGVPDEETLLVAGGFNFYW